MNKPQLRVARRVRMAGSICTVALVAMAFVPAAAESESTPGSRLAAYVVATNRGPLPACPQGSCGPTNTVWHFIHVVNANPLTNLNTGTTRITVPNAYVVGTVDMTVFVDGAQFASETFTPPPSITPPNFLNYSGHWPSTVLCDSGPPCNTASNPAVVPTENTAVLYAGWAHGDVEPDGTYVFRYTVHGTLNGTPVDLVAVSPRIKMIS